MLLFVGVWGGLARFGSAPSVNVIVGDYDADDIALRKFYMDNITSSNKI